jgi:hypothetical protein
VSETLFGVAALFATLRCPQLLGRASGWIPGAAPLAYQDHASNLPGGTFIIVMGEPLDSTRARRCGPGSFLVTPAGMRHAEWFEGETAVHVETEGPFETVFINPRDDPRNRARP